MSRVLAPNGEPARRVVARYEAAQWSPTRTGIWWPLQDARKDAYQLTRGELARLAWHLHQNSPIVRALIERLVTYIVGTGIHPVAASSNATWNEKADAVWRERSKAIELTCGAPWGSYLAQVCRCALVAGDCLTTFIDVGRPKLFLFESHQIGTPRGGRDATDGVVLDKFGRVKSFTRLDNGYEIPAEMAVLHWFAERPAQYRGVSVLASAINTARDVDDILAFEKVSTKEASSTTEVIERTADGPAVDPEGAYSGATWTTPDGQEREVYYQKRFGSAPKVMQPGDKYVKATPDRPSQAWQGFVDFLAQMICLSTGLPPSLLYGQKVGGADTRRELATGQRAIEPFQQALAHQAERIWRHIIEVEIEDGPLGGEPEDWASVEWQFPKAMTVDAGREAQQDREDVRMGTLSLREYFGRWGQDWRREMRQIATEKTYLDEIAGEYGIEAGDILQKIPPAQMAAQAGVAQPAVRAACNPDQPEDRKRKGD